MNEEINSPSEKEIKDAKATQAGRDIADTAGRAASMYFGGMAGAKVYDMASQTKAGQKIINNAGDNLTKSPVSRQMLSQAQPAISSAKPAVDQAIGASGNPDGTTNGQPSQLNKQESDNSSLFNSNNSGGNSSDFVKTAKNIKKYWPIIGPAIGFFFIMIVVLLVVSTMMSPLLYVADALTTTGDKMTNFFSGCGWATDSECNIKEQDNFYETIDSVVAEYSKKYNVNLNKELLVATLTYLDPFLNSDKSLEDLPTNSINYKKSSKQVEKLAKNMVTTVETCYLEDKIYKTKDEVPCNYENKMTSEEKKDYKFIKETYHVLDEEKFRNYLEGNGEEFSSDSFIIKYYFDNKYTKENKEAAKRIVDEIFSRVDFLGYLNTNTTAIDTFIMNNITVTITDCTGMTALEELSLSDYLQGVVYMYKGSSNSVEYLKFLAMTSKNYLYSINGATEDNMPTNLRIRNCELNQLFCNIKKGCHYMLGTGEEDDTLSSGPDDKGIYFKAPANDRTVISTIQQIIDDTLNEFLVKDGNIVKTQYKQSDMADVLNRLNSSTYKNVITELYGGIISTVDVVTSGYPLDLTNNRVTSLYGWRWHPVRGGCSHHNGIDIAAPANSNIYAFASGTVVINRYSNSYGYYTVIGHGAYDSSLKTYEYYTLYAHQIRLSRYVHEGSTVVSGQLIGSVGSTGTSTGNHLHFEIYTLNNSVRNRIDPGKYFTGVELTGLNINSPLYSSYNACLAAH